MKNLKTLLQKLVREESGQSTTEYILILAVVVMIAMKFRAKFSNTMDGAVNNLDSKLNEAFK
ncbi:MAG: hypothetical protein JNL01_11285 [Bdellovibrionales bacterium]|nr:hypothetical protein [Bdellovibrionales bacterium]